MDTSVFTGMFVFTKAPAHECLCKGQRRMSGDLLYHSLLCSIERGYWAWNPMSCGYTGGKHRIVNPFCSTGVTDAQPHLASYRGMEGYNSGPYPCIARSLAFWAIHLAWRFPFKDFFQRIIYVWVRDIFAYICGDQKRVLDSLVPGTYIAITDYWQCPWEEFWSCFGPRRRASTVCLYQMLVSS